MRKTYINDDLIGKRFKTKTGYFTVLRLTDLRESRSKVYEIEFDEYNGVKFKKFLTSVSIRRCNIKNPYFPTICGVGYTAGEDTKRNRVQYDRWRNMINRCYNNKDLRFKSYGAIGVKVCERWFSFKNFLSDIADLDGYNLEDIDNLSLDKDTKIIGNKIYSPSTCVFLPRSDNTKEMNLRVQQKDFIAISPDGEIHYSNNKKQFALKNDLRVSGINQVLNKKQDNHKGWKFEYNKKENGDVNL